MRHTLPALSLMLLCAGSAAQQGYSAKSLFFGEDDKVISTSTSSHQAIAQKGAAPAKQLASVMHKPAINPKQMGASYFIRLKNPDGTQRDVLASRHFKTGEKFQLGVKVNRPTYVYILNQEADGSINQIYPQPGRDNFINAMGTVMLPAQGTFEFDEKPGTEQLMVYMSATPMPGDMVRHIRSARADVVSAPADVYASVETCGEQRDVTQSSVAGNENANGKLYAAKGITFNAGTGTACTSPSEARKELAYASKGITFSEDSASGDGNQVAAYVVKPMAKADNNLFLKLNLVHE